jgi:ketosteroid isomerase-like protein
MAYWARLILLANLLGAGSQKPVDMDAERAAIIRTEAAFQKARAERGMEGWLDFFSDDTALLTPGSDLVFSKQALRERLTRDGWNSKLLLEWTPVKVDVAASCDLAYSVGTWRMTGTSTKDEPISLTGKFLTVWKKQADGSWKAVADIGNVDPQPAES